MGLFSTHPPTEQRIQALLRWPGRSTGHAGPTRAPADVWSIATRRRCPRRLATSASHWRCVGRDRASPWRASCSVQPDGGTRARRRSRYLAEQDWRNRAAHRRPRDRRSAPPRARAADERAHVSGVRAGRMGHVRRGHARRRAEPAHDPPGDRRAPAHDAVVRRPRAARVARDQARLQAGAAPRQPRRAPDDRGGRPVFGGVRGDAGRARVDPPAPRRRAGRAGHRG